MRFEVELICKKDTKIFNLLCAGNGLVIYVVRMMGQRVFFGIVNVEEESFICGNGKGPVETPGSDLIKRIL